MDCPFKSFFLAYVLHADALLQVFGATGHMGRSIVKTCLSHGDKVTAVGRVGEHTLDQMQGWHDSCLGLLCDVRVSKTVESVIQNTIRHFGAVDVIVKLVYLLRISYTCHPRSHH
jgi:NAD(P)-dependent dehydrogenase (short-subunit alcohol dehydrogenase family)